MPTSSLLLVLFACSDNTLGTRNTAPEASISSPSNGSTLMEGAVVTVTGTANDREDDGAALTVAWYADDAEICAGSVADDEGAVTCTWTATAGTEHLRLAVQDTAGATAEAEVSLTVVPNVSPEITIVAPLADGEYYADLPIELEATLSDPESDASELVVTWVSDVDDVVAEVAAVSSGTAATTAYLTEGTHTLTATVTDPGGKEGIDLITVVVHGANTSPECVVTDPLDSAAFALGDTIVFTGVATDAETAATALVLGLSSTEEPISDGDVVPVDDEGAFTYPWTPTVPGTHVVTLVGTDSLGASCTDTLTIEVCDTLWYYDGDSDGAGDPDRWVVACDQPEGYAATGDDCVDSSADIGPGAAEEDSFTDCMQDRDGDGYGDADVPAEVTPGTDCDDGDPAVSPDGAEVCDGADNDCDGTTDGATASDASAWYADTDADGYGDPATSRAECTQPVGYVADRTDCDDTTSLRAPDATEVCDSLDNNCDSVTDPDTSADAATWYRDRDGDGYGDSAETDLSCSAAAGYVADDDDCDDLDGEINPFAVEACNEIDDNCDGLVDEADPSVDCNEPPAITSVSLSPDPAYAGDSILCTPAGWSDADGDSEDYTYSWTVDSVAVAETSELLTEDLIRDQVVRCTATPDDGTEYGTARSATLRISNSPPSAPRVQITPTAPSAGDDDLVCVIDAAAVDPDGDSVTYTFAWTVDDVAYIDAIATSYADDTVPVEDAFADEVWTCSVVATDGDDAGAAGTDSVTLGESAQDGATPTRAGLSCDQIEADWPNSYNADYWVYPDGDVTADPALEACIFDNHTRVFAYSGTLDSWTVPSGVAYVTITAWGGGGAVGTQGVGAYTFNGGDGGTTVAILPATPGDVYTVVVGEGGIGAQAENTFTASADPGLLGGGGQGAPSALPGEDWTPGGGGGGGYSGVFSASPAQSTALVIAGGGGGGGGGGAGGDGGGLTADDGQYFFTSALTNIGGGGTQGAGGTANIGLYYLSNGAATTPVGAALYGGSGSYEGIAGVGDGGGGGGGGGYYGGGGGYSVRIDAGGGGGGGSGYVATAALTSALTTGRTATDDPDYDGAAGAQGTYTSSGPVSGGDGADGLIVIRY